MLTPVACTLRMVMREAGNVRVMSDSKRTSYYNLHIVAGVTTDSEIFRMLSVSVFGHVIFQQPDRRDDRLNFCLLI